MARPSFSSPILTRFLAPEEVGLVELGAVAIVFANVIISLEIGQGLARFVPDEAHASETRTIASTALWFSVAAYAVATVVVGIGLIIARSTESYVPAVMLAAVTGGLFLLVQGQLRWELRPVPYAITSFAFAAVTLIATTALLGSGAGVIGAFVGQAVGATIGLVLALIASRGSFGREFDRKWLKRLLAFSGPLVPASVGVLIALYVDRVVIATMLTLDDVARFSVGHRVASIVSLVMTAVQLALTPLIYASYRRAEAPAEIAEMFRFIVGWALGLWVAISLAAPEVVSLVAPESYRPAATVVPVLAPAIILSGLAVFAPGLAIARRTTPIALISIFGAILNVALCILLVATLGIIGAALATLTSGATAFALTVWYGQRYYPIPYDLGRIGVGLSAVVIVIVLSGVPFGAPIGTAWRIALAAATAALLVSVGFLRLPSRVVAGATS